MIGLNVSFINCVLISANIAAYILCRHIYLAHHQLKVKSDFVVYIAFDTQGMMRTPSFPKMIRPSSQVRYTFMNIKHTIQ